MNTAQRKFLVDKITERTKQKIALLRSSMPESISLNVYMLNKVMSNDFEIKPVEELKRVVLEKALKAGQERSHREDWLGNAWGVASKRNVAFELSEFFVIPEEYLRMQEERESQKRAIEEQIAQLQNQMETLEVRIMLASDKNLQRLVSEIDDMGDVAFIDTQIKLLS